MREQDEKLRNFISQVIAKEIEVVLVELSEDFGPGYTLLKCLENLDDREPCLVILGDTLFSFDGHADGLFEENFVLCSPVKDSARWCLAEVRKGNVASLLDKPETLPSEDWFALIGVYHFADVRPALESLRKEFESGSRNIQLRHSLLPYISSGSLRAASAKSWHDCGNLDSLSDTRRHLLQARSFNSIQIDDLKGTLTKRSSYAEKFLNEINYYRLLPNDVSVFFPRLVEYSLHPVDAHITLDYYGYPTLSEIWVFEELHKSRWKKIFESLRSIIHCFGEYSCPLAAESVFEFYWDKTMKRVAQLSASGSPVKALIAEKRLTVNGMKLVGWPDLVEDLKARVRAISSNAKGQIIHGDLCFPNILYDPTSHLFKLIDPRGSFYSAGIYGDARYDVAKLLHSIDGSYDYLIHDMFSLKLSGGEIDLDIFLSPKAKAVQDVFSEVFSSEYDMMEIRLLEGLLFISMCPLHEDNPQRQAAMFSIGVKILNEVLYADSVGR